MRKTNLLKLLCPDCAARVAEANIDEALYIGPRTFVLEPSSMRVVVCNGEPKGVILTTSADHSKLAVEMLARRAYVEHHLAYETFEGYMKRVEWRVVGLPTI